MALKLRRADERLIPQSTRAASFKRLLGGCLRHEAPTITEQRNRSTDWTAIARDTCDSRFEHNIVPA